MKKIEDQTEKLQAMQSQEDYFDPEEFNHGMTKFNKLMSLVEEVNLKEKFCYKRALVLCRSLLKQCRQTNENDHNLIQIVSNVIGPPLNSGDNENMGIALECVGLLTLLNKQIFSNYGEILKTVLTS